MFWVSWISFVGIAVHGQVSWRPVVLMHGIKTSASVMDPVVSWIQADYPGIYVKNVEIGDGTLDSMFLDLNIQVDQFAEKMRNDSKLANGFNLVGYSQGGLITRGYVQRYNDPPVYNYITWSGPHGGQFGVPYVNIEILDYIVDVAWDNPLVQESITFAEYWRDPYHLEEYAAKSTFLADLNNVNAINQTYNNNLLSLNSFTLLYSTEDKVIHPKESGWFQGWQADSHTVVQPLNQSAVFTALPLQMMLEQGRLHLFETSCKHEDYPTDKCKHWYDLYTAPILNNTVS